MRVLLDENLPVDLAGLLGDHEVESVTGLGWAGVKNGELLRRMGGKFGAFITMDRSLPHQQNLAARSFGVVLVEARSNQMTHIRPLVSKILIALDRVHPGEILRVFHGGRDPQPWSDRVREEGARPYLASTSFLDVLTVPESSR